MVKKKKKCIFHVTIKIYKHIYQPGNLKPYDVLAQCPYGRVEMGRKTRYVHSYINYLNE
jgi:hypothetical protein